MANKRIAGITVEIGGDTTKLGKALGDVDKKTKGVKNELKDVNKLLKLDPTNTTLLAQKQQLLAENVEKSRQKLDLLRQSQKSMSDQLRDGDIDQEAYDKFQEKLTKAHEKLEQLRQQQVQIERQFQSGEIDQGAYDAFQRKISEAESRVRALETAENSMEENVRIGNISEEQYRAFQREVELATQDLRDAEREAENFNATAEKVKAVGEAFEEVGGKIENAGKKITPISAAVAGLGGVAVKTAADFDTSMSKVKAISGATDEELQQLRDKAREMGATTKFSASEVADAMTYMAMAGWKTEDMLQGIEGVLNLAAASGEDLSTTSDIVTDALTALGMTASDTEKFADVLAAASSNANTNVSMMGESFKYVAPLTGAIGASSEDLAIALGLMANSGIKASQAGTTLNNALTQLNKPTKEQKVAMEKLGLITAKVVGQTKDVDYESVEKASNKVEKYTTSLQKAQIRYNDALSKYGENASQTQLKLIDLQQAQKNLAEAQDELNKAQNGGIKEIVEYQSAFSDEYGNMKSLKEIMDILRSSFKSVNVELVDSNGELRDYDDIINELSQTEEELTQVEQLQNAALIFGKRNLSGMLSIINASDEDYQKLTESIYNASGTTEKMATIMQDNLEGQLTILKSQLQELAISFGDILMPVVRKITSWIQKLVDKFNSLSDSQKKTITKIAAVVAAVGPLLIIIGKITTGIGGLITGVSKMITGVSKISAFIAANPATLVVAAIASIIAILVTLYNKSETFRNFVNEVWEGAKIIFHEFGEMLKEFGEVLKEVWGVIKSFFTNAQEIAIGVIDDIVSAFKLAIGTIKDIWNDVVKFLKGVCESIKGIFSGVASFFKGIFKDAADGAKIVWGEITGFFSGVWGGIKSVFGSVVSFFRDKFQKALNAIKSVFSGIGDFFGGIWDSITERFSEIGTKVGEVIGKAFKGAINAVIATVEGALNLIPNAINGAIDLINKLPGVEISAIPTVELPRLAKGGTLSEGSAIVAEAGPELIQMFNGKARVTPLTGTAKNNAVSSTQNTQRTVVHQTYNIYVKEFAKPEDARITSQELARLERQTAFGKGVIPI